MKVRATVEIVFDVYGDVGDAMDELEIALGELGNSLESNPVADGEYQIVAAEQVKE